MTHNAHPDFQVIKDAIVEACNQGRYDRVDALVAQAWNIAHAGTNQADAAEAHWCSGLAWMHRQSTVALEHFDAAYAYYAHSPLLAARVQVNRGPLLARLGRIEEGSAALDEAEATLRAQHAHERLLSLVINRSELEGRAGRYQRMRTYAQEAEQLALTLGFRDVEIMAGINQAVAALFLGNGEYALGILARMHTLAKTEQYHDLFARVAVNQAHVHIAHDRLIQALHALREAREHFSADLAVEAATIAGEAAKLYERLGMYAEAYRAARSAAQIFHAHDLAEESVEALLLALKVTLIAEQQLPAWIYDHQRQIVHEREALCALALRQVPHVSPVLQARFAALHAHPLLQPETPVTTLIAQVDAATATLDAAGMQVAAVESGLIGARLLSRTERREALRSYQSSAAQAAALGQPALAQQAYEGMSQLLRGRAARNALQRAMNIASLLQQHMPVEELKARSLAGHTHRYARLAELYLREGDALGALQTVIQAKGRFWIDAATQHPHPAPDSAWLAARAALLFWEERHREALNEADQEHCDQQIQSALLTLRTLRRERPTVPIPTFETIQGAIPPKSVAIEYILGEQYAFAWVVRCSGPPQWVKLGKTQAIRDAAERLSLRLHPLMRLPSTEQRTHALAQRRATDTIFAELHTLLIAPLAAELTSPALILAPDSALMDLPWAAFYDATQATQPYLGERHTLSLVPSLAVLTLSHTTNPTQEPLALGAADPMIAPQVAAELTTFATYFPTATVLAQASRSHLTQARSPAVVHISAHGHLNPQQPLLSSIEFMDGPLLVADIFNLDLAGTTLAILSACETNAVAPLGGVALAIAGAFLAAGVQAAVAGLWKIDAEAARIFVAACYGSLQQNHLAVAIQDAQQAVRAAGYDHPYFWAALQPLMRAAEVRLPTTDANVAYCPET